jgi:hypothetical protein
MDATKIAMMVEYLRVLGELKRSNVYCNDEIQAVMRKLGEMLDETN